MVALETESQKSPVIKTVQIATDSGFEFVDLFVVLDANMPPDQSIINLEAKTLTIAPVRISY